MKQSRMILSTILMLPVMMTACDQSSIELAGMPPIADIRSVGAHYIVIEFASPAEAMAGNTSNYHIVDGGGTPLAVLDAALAADGGSVRLTTGQQSATEYVLSSGALDDTLGSIRFLGSTQREPFLESAIALSNTQLLLTFSAQMQAADLENIAYYELDAVGGAAPTVPRITAAVAGSDSRTVVLTTTPLERLDYSVRVTNVNRRYTCADDGRVFLDEVTQGGLCAPSVRPVTTTGSTTEFVITSRQNTNPADDALVTGMAGYIVASADGLGVSDAGCSGGSPSVDGDDSANGGNEELIFTPDAPVPAADLILGLARIDLGTAQADHPRLFLSSTGSATFDYAFDESDLAAAFNYAEDTTDSSNDSAGDVVFADLAGLPAGLMIDEIKFRVGEGEVYVHSICGLPVGGRLIDPTRNTARFLGMGAVDTDPPQLLAATSTSDRSVVLSFSEPLSGAADNPTLYAIDNGLAVLSAELAQHDTQVIVTTLPQNVEVTYEVTVSGVQDRAGNLIDPAADSTLFGFRGGPANLGAAALPRVVGARSAGNTAVLVTFNKPMGPGAEDAANYVIVQQDVNPEVGALGVQSAAFVSGQADAVELVTSSQNEVTYLLTVVNVRDQSGNQLAPPELLVNPATASFAGTPFSCPFVDNDNDGENDIPCGLPDTDGDGLPDSVEQRGYVVTVDLGDGDIDQREVTSDPTTRDTDGDGLNDAIELNLRSDPRLPDTDGDTLTDYDEYNVFFSDTNAIDSDEDGLDDAIEVDFYRTSPILADTDGDGFDDTEEVIEFNRNPRIADLPRPGINIGNMRVTIDERYSTTTEEGESLTIESSSSTTLSQGSDTSFSSSETDVTGSSREIFVNGGLELEFSKSLVPDVTVSAEAGVTWNSHSEHTSQFSQESTISAQETREASIAKGQALSTTTAVTREITGARVDLDLTIENEGDIAFAITNLEVTMLQSTGLSNTDFEPIGTLVANSALISGEDATFNLGPFTTELGPFIFRDRDIFPSEVDSLLANPRGLLFEIANYDILDEFGRNFAFASQTARDRTAGITIDFGDDGVVERFLVSTAGVFDSQNIAGGGFIGGFDAAGAAAGLPIDFILQDTLRMAKNSTTPDGILAGPDGVADSLAQGDDIQLIPFNTFGLTDDAVVIDAGQNGVLDTTPSGDDETEVITGYGTSATCSVNTTAVTDPNDADILLNGPGFPCDTNADCPGAGTCTGSEVLVRVRNRRIGDFNRVWAVFSSGLIPAGADFGQIVLSPGDDLTLAFIQDLDRDGLFAREEYLYGSSDKDVDTDLDGLGDFAEVRVGWEVGVVGEDIRTVYPDPRVPDSDGDGLEDGEEQDLRRLFCRCNGGSNDDLACGDDGDCPSGSCVCGDIWVCDSGDDEGQACSSNASCRPQSLNNAASCSVDSDCSSGQVCYGGACATEVQCLEASSGTPPQFADVFSGAAPTDGPVRADPRNGDTDSDEVDDMDEIAGYLYGVSIQDGGNGESDTPALSDDVQKVFVGNVVGPSDVAVLPGPNGVLDSIPGGDDVINNGTTVVTNPLDPDHDGDTRPDGQERDAGSNPDDANDSLDFLDSDRDGLSDAVEEQVGWTVDTDTSSAVTVYSSRFVADTDFDGLPDLLERELESNPNRADTDGDGLLDYDEFAGFANFIILGNLFPGFVLDGTNSLAIGTALNDTDTDGDGRSDYEEQFEGWLVPVGGDVQTVMSSPLLADGDLDGLDDSDEEANSTDPQNPDTDGDGRSDGDEIANGFDPLLPDLVIRVEAAQVVMLGGDPDGDGIAKWAYRLKAQVFGVQSQSSQTITTALTAGCDGDGENTDCGLGGAITLTDSTGRQCTNLGNEDFTMQEGDELVLFLEFFEYDTCNEDGRFFNCGGSAVVEIPFSQVQAEPFIFEQIEPIQDGGDDCTGITFKMDVEVTRE